MRSGLGDVRTTTSRADNGRDLYSANVTPREREQKERQIKEKIDSVEQLTHNGRVAKGRENGPAPMLFLVMRGVVLVPVMLLVIGPRKIAQQMAPYIKKFANYVPNLMEEMLKHLARLGQLSTAPLQKWIQAGWDRAMQWVRTSVSKVEHLMAEMYRFGNHLLAQALRPFQAASAFLDQAMASLAQWVQKFSTAMMDPFATAAAALKEASARLFERMFQPLANAKSALEHVAKQIEKHLSNLAKRLKESYFDPVHEAYERAARLVRKAQEKASNAMQKAAEALVTPLQAMVQPMINLAAMIAPFIKLPDYGLMRRFRGLFSRQRNQFGELAKAYAKYLSQGAKRYFNRKLQQFLSPFKQAGAAVTQALYNTAAYIGQEIESWFTRFFGPILKYMRWLLSLIWQNLSQDWQMLFSEIHRRVVALLNSVSRIVLAIQKQAMGLITKVKTDLLFFFRYFSSNFQDALADVLGSVAPR